MGHRLTSKNIRRWSLLILLLSVASTRKKLLKTTHTEEPRVHTNSESCNIRLRSKIYQFNSKQIIQILQPFLLQDFSDITTFFIRCIRIQLSRVNHFLLIDATDRSKISSERSLSNIFRRKPFAKTSFNILLWFGLLN